ncbi:uncharacterized protein LOC116005267 [Ipomoea triloba]|uniref:uncharacterized protein LOC116005267 n=1 Tax=Ipomoea triloba TaxID=35885 RepID=UPI00125D7ADB|nr:uncharacterized protein LOC116005267 [Ipomoea triloba]
MATWPPINSRSAPIDNTTRNSARNATIGNATHSSSVLATGSTATDEARAMTMALSCKNKIAFINGAIRKPSKDDLEKYLVWERCNNMVKKQVDNSLNEYFTRHKLLWDELIILRPSLRCGKKLDDISEQSEKDKLSIFLAGLHEKYTGPRNQIMLIRPLPYVNEAYSMIAQQERQFQMATVGP